MNSQAAPMARWKFWAFSPHVRERFLGVASPVGLLLVWELAARFGIIDTRFFPAPSSIMALMVEMIRVRPNNLSHISMGYKNAVGRFS